jgi:hypothetical protein
MSLRISDTALLALLLAACSPSASGAPAGAPGDDLIDCATGGAAGFTHDCAVERTVQDGAPLMIVHHPDGGFRRFKVIDGGRSLVAADGAESLAIAANGDRIDVSVDSDRYRFPAAMLTDAGH